MKTTKHIIFIFLLLFLASCSNNGKNSQVLQRADDCLMSNPDSTLVFLSQIPDSRDLPKSQSALYCLLKSAALYKTDQKQSDSLIAKSVKFYENHNDGDRLMQAYYYIAGITEENGDILQAQDYYLKSLEAGQNSKDYILLGKTNNHLGMMYTYQGLYKFAIPRFRKALEYHKIMNNKQGQSFVLRDLGRVYSVVYENNPDSAIMYYEQALQFANKESLSTIQNELGSLYSKKKDYDKAKYYIFESIKNEWDSSDLLVSFHTLGHVYYDMHKLDSAKFYLNKSFKSENLYTLSSTYHYFAKIEAEEKNLEKSNAYYERYIELLEKIKAQTDNSKIAQAEQMYNYKDKEEQLSKVKIKAMQSQIFNLVLSIVAIILLFVIVTYIFYTQKEREKLKREELEQQKRFKEWQEGFEKREQRKQEYISELEKRETQKEQELENYKTTLEESRKQGAEYQKQMQELEKQIGQNNITYNAEAEPIISKFNSSKDWKPKKSDWNALTVAIDKLYNGFTLRLKTFAPLLDERDIRACQLLKIGIKQTYIANLINVTAQGVAMYRIRLYKKITGQETDSSKTLKAFLDDF